MVSKSQLKLITGLRLKKHRQQHGLFVVEGTKGVQELLDSAFEVEYLFCTQEVYEHFLPHGPTRITEAELKKMSSLTSPQLVLGVFRIPGKQKCFVRESGLTLVLDDIRDPGNLGTIIRTCDWFGVRQILCSPSTVDCYNPKVVQATMGSLGRVAVVYMDLHPFLGKSKIPVFGAYMEGQNIYEQELPTDAILVLGNEANGISSETEACIDHTISIPQVGRIKTESLNVAIAAAIMVSEFKRGFILN